MTNSFDLCSILVWRTMFPYKYKWMISYYMSICKNLSPMNYKPCSIMLLKLDMNLLCEKYKGKERKKEEDTRAHRFTLRFVLPRKQIIRTAWNSENLDNGIESKLNSSISSMCQCGGATWLNILPFSSYSSYWWCCCYECLILLGMSLSLMSVRNKWKWLRSEITRWENIPKTTDISKHRHSVSGSSTHRFTQSTRRQPCCTSVCCLLPTFLLLL